MSDNTWKSWVPAGLVAVGIFVGSALPGGALPRTRMFVGEDKLVHAAEYAIFGYFVARAWRRRARVRGAHVDPQVAPVVDQPARTAPIHEPVALAAAFALGYGITDEFHQSFVPGRAVELADLIADTVGGAVGGGFSVILNQWRQRRQQRRARLRQGREP